MVPTPCGRRSSSHTGTGTDPRETRRTRTHRAGRRPSAGGLRVPPSSSARLRTGMAPAPASMWAAVPSGPSRPFCQVSSTTNGSTPVPGDPPRQLHHLGKGHGSRGRGEAVPPLVTPLIPRPGDQPDRRRHPGPVQRYHRPRAARRRIWAAEGRPRAGRRPPGPSVRRADAPSRGGAGEVDPVDHGLLVARARALDRTSSWRRRHPRSPARPAPPGPRASAPRSACMPST